MWNATPEALLKALRANGLRRAYLVTEPKSRKLVASDPLLDEIASVVRSHDDYHGHQGYFLEIGQESKYLLSAAVHKTRRGQAAGGVRFWQYPTAGEFIRDGLRLSRGMGQKNALAGLHWGGGKGVIARKPHENHTDPELRAKIYRDYGRMMSGLCGCYITAEDVGTRPEDMAHVFSTTRHTTCIPVDRGGSGNPSQLTAAGVVVGMEAGLEFLSRTDRGGKTLPSLHGATIAMQGLGNVSIFMIGLLLERGVKKIIGSDVDPAAIDAVKRAHGDTRLDLRLVDLDDTSIFSEPADVFVPNATGAILNPKTIAVLASKVVCGAANNQLELADRDGPAIDKKALYVPDFLCNRMGIVNCANEQYGSITRDPAILAHLDRQTPHGIFRRAIEVFERAQRSTRSVAQEAEALAEELMEKPHPIWPDRSQEIIDDLVQNGWAKK
jgi:leucine dehydrogenase